MMEMEREQQEILKSIEDRIQELKEVKQSMIKCQNDMMCLQIELKMVREANDRLTEMVKSCVKELCKGCVRECKECRWNSVREWKSDDEK